jgi:hypothetical protein
MPKGTSSKIAISTIVDSEIYRCPCGKDIVYVKHTENSGRLAIRLHKRVCDKLKGAKMSDINVLDAGLPMKVQDWEMGRTTLLDKVKKTLDERGFNAEEIEKKRKK